MLNWFSNLNLPKILLWGILSTLAVFAVLYIIYIVQMVPAQYQLTDDEGVFWYAAKNGLSVYKDINIEPYISINNPPVYSALVGLLIKIFGSSLIVGRVVSVLAFLGTCGLIYGITKLLTKDKLISAISGMLPLAVWFFTYWSVTFRADILGLPLVLSGVYIVLKYGEGTKLYWSIPLFVLALFTKQIFVSAPIAICIYLFFKNRKICLKYAVLLIALVLTGIGILNIETEGYFLKGILDASLRPTSYNQLLGLLVGILRGTSFVILLLSFWYLITNRKSLGVLGIYFLVTLIVFLYQISNSPGAWLSYGLELIAVGCILSGLLLYQLYIKSKSVNGLKIFVLTIVILVLIGFCNFANLGYKPGSSLSANYQLVSKYIQEYSDPILADSTTLLMINNRELIWESTSLIQAGLVTKSWNQSPILRDIKVQRFSLVIMEFEISRDWTNSSNWEKARLSPEIAEEILNHYELMDTIGLYRLYTPKLSR